MWFRKWRRDRLRRRPFPEGWGDLLFKRVLLYRHLPPQERERLHGHIHVFLNEKGFEGAGGFKVTEETKLVIAAQACLLVLNHTDSYFPGLYSIIIYPTTYLAPRREWEAGVVVEGVEARVGETWPRGTLVLAWDAVLKGAKGLEGCRNVVLHEFAHQLDYLDGKVDGAPPLPGELRSSWPEAFGQAFRRHEKQVALGLPTFLDPYGAKSPAEFFATAVEAFFMCPRAFKARHPVLYRQLSRYFLEDPARWMPR
ncbi:MAG: hypothetical protein XD60_1771 [Acetothermia bacterium 64_32]|nr:MAG: hypothetical protein XD60_1771 [Acetothermia bacterium 64_32]HAF70286.1 hypothetical protein [Candidatus Acetothermia bacterium]